MTGTHIRHPHTAEPPGSSRIPGSVRRRAFFFLLPNLADDSQLDVYAFRLLAHYQRVAGPDGRCAESTATTAARCGMSPRRAIQARARLAEEGWISLDHVGPAGQQVPVISLVDRMADNLARYGRRSTVLDRSLAPSDAETEATSGLDGEEPPAPAAPVQCTSSRPPLHVVQAPPAPAGRTPDKTPEGTGIPPLTPHAAPQQQQQWGGIGPTETNCPSMSPPGTTIDEAARTLVAAFYRGLGTSPSAATIAMQRRDLAIARQLVHAGATPHEAETYAREMSGLEGRLAPVDLRSFERERPCWLARQHRREKRHVDRTGLPPSWQAQPGTPNAPTAGIPEPPPSTGCTRLAAPADEHRALTGQHLGRALRAVLAGGGG